MSGVWNLPSMHKWSRNVCVTLVNGGLRQPHRHGFATVSVGSSLHPTTIIAQNALRLQQSQAQRQQQHGYSTKRPSFFSQFVDNLKQEMEKNKDMKDNIAKFREEAQKLEQSDALKTARQKFNTVESEANKGGEQLRERLDSLKDRVQDVLQEAGKSDIGKRASNLGEELSRSARGVTDTISEKTQKLGQTNAFQSISAASQAVRDEMDSQGIHGRVYQRPVKLRRRVETFAGGEADRAYAPNDEALGIELHRDSKFYQSWENFKNNNQYVNKVLDWKIRYEESENPVIRASRLLTDKVSDIMGNMFSKTELSETLTEICRIDPAFTQKDFLRDCEADIIPNVLEAMVRGDLEVLRDWCFEGTYNVIATPIAQAQKAGYYLDSKILDIEHVDLAMGKVMDQGPVLVVTFQAQQIMCVRDRKTGAIVEGDADKIMRVHYVWVLCRDPAEMNPKAAWRLMELSANSSEQLV